MADRIQLRRDTEANWIETDPILAQGEIAVTLDDLDTEPKFKIGDGLTLWSVLPYFGGTELTQIQSDWNQANDLLADYIKNKPTGTADGDVLTWDETTGTWLPEQPTIMTLPAGEISQTLKHNGTDWVANSQLTIGAAVNAYDYQMNLTANEFSVGMLSGATTERYKLTISKQYGVQIAEGGTYALTIKQEGEGRRLVLYMNNIVLSKDIASPFADYVRFPYLAGTGDRYIGADSTGRVKVMPATKGLAVHATDQIIPSTISIAASNFQIAGKANKKYMVDYRLYLLNSANEFSPNIQVRIGDGSGTETAYGSLLACHNDTASYNLYKVIDGTPNFNSLFDWAQGRAVYLHGGNYMHLDLQVIVEMGSTDKTIDLYITLPTTPTTPPEFTIRARSYMRWEEF